MSLFFCTGACRLDEKILNKLWLWLGQDVEQVQISLYMFINVGHVLIESFIYMITLWLQDFTYFT